MDPLRSSQLVQAGHHMGQAVGDQPHAQPLRQSGASRLIDIVRHSGRIQGQSPMQGGCQQPQIRSRYFQIIPASPLLSEKGAPAAGPGG